MGTSIKRNNILTVIIYFVGADSICIGQSDNSDFANVPALSTLLNESPGGGTPLCFHVRTVIEQIQLIAPQLRAAGM